MDFAAKLKSPGNMYFPKRKAITDSTISLSKALVIRLIENDSLNVAKSARTMKTTTSCISKIPRASLPWRVSICSESDSNLITTIVLENVRTNPIIVDSNWANPRESAVKYPMT